MRYGGRHLAPINPARSAAESEAPWAWRDVRTPWAFFRSGWGIGRDVNTSGTNAPTSVLSKQGRSVSFDQSSSNRISSLTNLVPPSGNFTVHTFLSIPSGEDPDDVIWCQGDSAGRAYLYGVTDFGSAIKSVRLWQNGFGEIVVGPDIRGDGFVLVTVRRIGDEFSIFVDGELSASASASVTFNDDQRHTIGAGENVINGWERPFNGRMSYVFPTYRGWSDQEISTLGSDPFAPFRRRRILIPVSSGGGTSVAVSEAASGGDAWEALVIAPVSLTEPASASDTYSAIATVGASLVEAVAAQDANGGPATTLGAFTDAASADDLTSAVAQASAALSAGAAAGESWVAQAQAVVDLVEAGAAGDTITQGATSAEQAAVDEGSAAGDAFAAAIQAVATLTEAASAADALVATVTAMVTLTESAAAGSTFTASTEAISQQTLTSPASASDSLTVVGQVITALQEGIAAGAVYAAAASVTAAINEGAIAGDSWSAVVPGTGYLVASAITITAALSGAPSIAPALTGKASLKPQE